MRSVIARDLIPALLLLPGTIAAQAVERFELTGNRIAVFNLAGSARASC